MCYGGSRQECAYHVTRGTGRSLIMSRQMLPSTTDSGLKRRVGCTLEHSQMFFVLLLLLSFWTSAHFLSACCDLLLQCLSVGDR